jgi:RND family efflux transporter MFP subunit
MTTSARSERWSVWWTVAIGLAFTTAVVFLLLWLAGVFHPKIEGGQSATSVPAERSAAGVARVGVRAVDVPVIESAVGTIRAVHETAVASKLLAKVIEVNANAGQTVSDGDVLVRLDDEDLRARLRQAEAASTAAQAARDQAKIEYDRIQSLFEQDSASKIEWDRTRTALSTAEAELDRAKQTVNEARTILGYANIRSPLTGIIIDKKVEVGDTAQPGQVLLSLYDPTRMQLVASVRESLTQRLEVGQIIDVRIDSLDKQCGGQISEIVPEAESASRTFLVKVTGPCPPGVYSGMFGRLLIPLDKQTVTVIPWEAVRQVGQLDIVDVVEQDTLQRRLVQLGRRLGDDVEVLSGLKPGEQVAIPAEHATQNEERSDG